MRRSLIWSALCAIGAVVTAVAAGPPAKALPLERTAIQSGACSGILIKTDFVNASYCENGQQYPSFLAMPGASFTRGSSGTATDSAGNVLSFASGQLRFTDLGLLVEGASTNLLVWSQAVDNAGWFKGSATVSADSAAAPDGTQTADVVTFTGAPGGNQNFQQTITTVIGSVYTFSIWLQGTGTVRMDSIGSGAAVQVSLTGAWTRLAGQYTATSTSTFFRIISDSGKTATAVTVWGAQIELSSFASSYVPTAGSPVTRAQDIVRVAPIAASVTGYTMSVFYTVPTATTAYRGIMSLNDTTSNNTTDIGSFNLASYHSMNVGGVSQSDFNSTFATPVNTAVKSAYSVMAGRQMPSVGGALASATTGALNSGNLTLMLGGDAFGRSANAYLKRLVIYPAPLSDGQLQVLTQ